MTDENGIPFNSEQIEEYFSNLAEDKKIGALAKLILFVHKDTKNRIAEATSIDKCKERMKQINKENFEETEKNINRLGTATRNIFLIGEKAIVVIIFVYLIIKEVLLKY